MDTAIGLRLERALRVYLAACRRVRTERAADGLLDLLQNVLEPEVRLYRFGEHLRSRPADEAARTMAYVHERLADGDSRAHRVGLGLLDRDRLARVLPPEQLHAIGEALRRRGHSSAGLFDLGAGPGAATDDDVLPRPREPVGYRISLARRALAGVVERLLFDPDPRVVQTLLGNPRLTEPEVLKLAASRRTTPEALAVVAQDERWIARYPVKVALVSNPATPTRIVVGLLPYLMCPDLRDVSASASRNEVRVRAAALLAHRSSAASLSGSRGHPG